MKKDKPAISRPGFGVGKFQLASQIEKVYPAYKCVAIMVLGSFLNVTSLKLKIMVSPLSSLRDAGRQFASNHLVGRKKMDRKSS